MRGSDKKIATEVNENEDLSRKNNKSYNILDKHMKDNSIRNNSNSNHNIINNKRLKKLAEILETAPKLQLKVKYCIET